MSDKRSVMMSHSLSCQIEEDFHKDHPGHVLQTLSQTQEANKVKQGCQSC